MTISFTTNIVAEYGNRMLGRHLSVQQTHIERLSSGLRITKGADDASGLAISEELTAHNRSWMQVTKNINEGVSLCQVADAGLNEIGSILIRLRELAVQSANDTLGDEERQSIDDEKEELLSEIDRIANTRSIMVILC